MLSSQGVKILLIGARGQLGQEILAVARDQGNDEIVPVTHEQLDIRDAARVRDLVQRERPQCIINTAAFHKVDLCEDEPETTFAVNEGGARNLAEAAEEIGALMLQLSTDYVFDGEKTSPYVESDEARPISVYGRSRLAGERAVAASCRRFLIIRTCGLYGLAGKVSKMGNFVETMLRLAEQGKSLRVVSDQVCTPTSARELARKMLPLIHSGAQGLFHMSNTGECSWFQFAQEIFRSAGVPADVKPVTSEEYAAKARRPKYSVLDNRAFRHAGFADFSPWNEALSQYMEARRQPWRPLA